MKLSLENELKQVYFYSSCVTVFGSLEHACSVENILNRDGFRCLDAERLALLRFKDQLIDDYKVLESWGSVKHEKECCEWIGVSCDNKTNGVVGLSIQSESMLRGDISDALGDLSSLQVLNISKAYLEGKIHNFFRNLVSLSFLDLSYNLLEGKIPGFLENLTKLSYLDLSHNKFEGELPGSWGNLGSLSTLDLSHNKFGGKILNFLGNLTSLSALDLSHNYFEGMIPAFLGNLTSLSSLDLSDNILGGKIPDFFGNLKSLSSLNLSGRGLEGVIPEDLWNLPNLKYLDLSDNKLQGHLPPSFKNLSNLSYLDLSANQINESVPDFPLPSSLSWLNLGSNLLRGTLPVNIGSLSRLRGLLMGSNDLEGIVSETHFLNCSRLQELDLSFNPKLTVMISSQWKPPFQIKTVKLTYCSLGPKFPHWFQNQETVTHLDVSNCKISDTIPDWFWSNSKVFSHLNMSYNQISGGLPDFSNMFLFWLRILDLRSNEFNGSVPPLPRTTGIVYLGKNKLSGTLIDICRTNVTFSYGQPYSLTYLDLSDNLISGNLPECLPNFDRLEYLNLADNDLSGEISNSILWPLSLSSLHLWNNRFRGEIPSSLRRCSNLATLILGKNYFSGNVPTWIGESLSNLRFISLKFNSFSVSLPPTLCYLVNLQVLDLSANEISGAIPNCISNFTFRSSEPFKTAELTRITPLCPTNMYGSCAPPNIYAYFDSLQIVWKRNDAEYSRTLSMLTLIDLSSNDLAGEIPYEITTLHGLFALNLSGNSLVGSIPRHIGQMEVLNVLDLSNNSLSGAIPDTLPRISHLGVLNLSFNSLSGKIPWEGHLNSFDNTSFLGNSELCGLPLSKHCPGEGGAPRPVEDLDGMGEDDEFVTRGFYVSLTVGFIVGFWGAVGALIVCKSFRYAYFRMLEWVGDWVYVTVAVNWSRFRKYVNKTNNK